MRFKIGDKVEAMNDAKEDIVVDGSCVRMRQTWDDEKWVLMGKSSQVPQHKSMVSNEPLKTRTLKRISPYGSSVQLKAVEKEKVDAVAAHPKEVLGRKNMHFKSKGLHELKGKQVLAHSSFKSSVLISSDGDSDDCSVGSCDVATHKLYSDAESFYGLILEKRMEVEVSVRGLELHAYRTTLEALYASGPLSWEQEAMLTNLRIMLHISNDEHLKELKHLISTRNGVSVISQDC